MLKTRKRILPVILAFIVLLSTIVVNVNAAPTDSATQYRITATTKTYSMSAGAVVSGTGNQIVFKAASGPVGASLTYAVPIDVVRKTGSLKIDVGAGTMPYLDVEVYWDTSTNRYYDATLGWQGYILKGNGVGTAARSHTVDLTAALGTATAETKYAMINIGMADLNGISAATDTAIIDNILFYNPNLDIAPASTAFNIIRDTAPSNYAYQGNITYVPYGTEGGYTLKSSNGQPTGTNSNFYWLVPVSVIKANPYLKLGFDASSTARITMLTNVYGGASLSGIAIDYTSQNPATMGNTSFNLTTAVAGLTNDQYVAISIYLVDTTGSQVVNLNCFEFNSSDFPPDRSKRVDFTPTPVFYQDGNMSASTYGTNGIKFSLSSGPYGAMIIYKSAIRTQTPYLMLEIDQSIVAQKTEIPKIHILAGDNAIGASTKWVYNAKPINEIQGLQAINLLELFGSSANGGAEYITIWILSNTPQSVEFKQLYLGWPPLNENPKASSCAISYELGGGSNSPANPIQFVKGDSFTLAAPTKANATFQGWTDGAMTYGTGETYTPTTDSVTLTAIWGYNGDIDGNDRIDVLDLINVRRMLSGKRVSDKIADYNQDGNVNIVDLLLIKNIVIDLSAAIGNTDGYAPRLQNSIKSEYAMVTAAGAQGTGIIDDSLALTAAIAKASTINGSIYLPTGKYKLSSNVTVPGNVEIIFDVNAVIAPDLGVTFTMNGTITAGNYQIFGGTGTITGSQLSAVGNPMWFGAKGDGINDDTAAFQKTVNMFLQVDVPVSVNGYVISGSGIMLRENQKFQGADNQQAKLIGAAGSEKIIQIPYSGIQVKNFDFDMSNSASGICVYFDNSSIGLDRILVANINTANAYRVVTDANTTNRIVTTTLEKISALRGKGSAFVLNNFWGFIYLTDITVDNSQSGTVNFSGIELNKNEGGVLTNVNVIGNNTQTSGANGFFINNSVAVWMYNCSATNNGAAGFYITGTSGTSAMHIYVQGCSANYNKAQGFYIKGSYLQFENITASNNGSYGMYVYASSSSNATRCITVSNSTFSGNGSHGISVASGNTYSVFSNIIGNNNTGYLISGAAATNSYVNISGTGNTSGITNSAISGRVTTAA